MAAVPTTSLVFSGPFHTVLVDTTTDCVVTIGANDIDVQHLGLTLTQTNSTAATTISACGSTDYVCVTDPNCTRYVATSQQGFANGDATANFGHKALLVPGSSGNPGAGITFRGFDLITAEVTGRQVRQFTLRCLGTVPVLVQLSEGSFAGAGI